MTWTLDPWDDSPNEVFCRGRLRLEQAAIAPTRAAVYSGQVKLTHHLIGRTVRVQSVLNGYPLPQGLPEKAEVTVLEFVEGWYVVEYQGKRFEVGLLCVIPPPPRA